MVETAGTTSHRIGGRALPAYGQTQVSRDDRKRGRGEFPTCWLNNAFLTPPAGRGKSRALHPALEKRRQLGEVVDRRVRLDVDRLLRRSRKRPPPDRTQTQALCAPYVLDHAVAHHDGVARRDAREVQRPTEDRLVWLLPADGVRAGHMIDRVVEPEAPEVFPDFLVATPER